MFYRAFCTLLAAIFVVLGFGCGGGNDHAAPGHAGPDGAACSTTPCPTGCCDPSGRCQVGTSATACGIAGEACQDCTSLGLTSCDPARHACYEALDSCTAATCAGCCAQNLCYPGEDSSACGSGGQACQVCGSGLVCAGQECTQACSPSNCEGCCANNVCVGGLAPTACGSAGATCVDCTATGATCASADGSGGACQSTAWCSSTTCPAGCCDASGICQAGTLEAACGSGGASCQTCGAGSLCVGQTCFTPCTPESCPSGCCDATSYPSICRPGNAPEKCGAGGSRCEACVDGPCASQKCVQPVHCFGCQSGCCDTTTGQCILGTSNTQCGIAGGYCVDCAALGEQCSSQECIGGDGEACNVETCPSGCCDFAGHCQQGLTSSVCGTGAVLCRDCLDIGEACVNQACVATDACQCPNGCCDPTTGACDNGQDDRACGVYGETCADCTQFGAVCSQSACALPGGPTCQQTCLGCCDAAGNCQSGFADSACGKSQTALCEDCTKLDPPSTCDLGLSPPVCASEETSCPGPYPGCPVGLEQSAPAAGQNVCSAAELANASAACAGGPESTPCDDFFRDEDSANTPCYDCLQYFNYDFSAQVGIVTCAAPYVNASCNRESACLVDCIAQSCSGCGLQSSSASCTAHAMTAQCATYAQGDACVTQALGGPAALCNPTTYQGNFGAWLQAVGAQYCGP